MQGGDLGTFQHCAAVVFRCVEFCLIVSCVEFYDVSIYNTSYALIYYRHIIDSAKGFLHQALIKTIGMFVVLSFDKVFNSDVSIASWKVINECVK